MTEKELLYMEDAYEHEKSIISILNDMVEKLSDNNLVSFINEQITNHENIKESLMNVLKENANE